MGLQDKSRSAVRSLLLSNPGYLFSLMQISSKNQWYPSWVAWTKSELLSNPDKASVTPCLTATFLATFFIPYSHHVVYKFCGEAGRIGSRSPAYHSMDKYRMCSEKWHDRATLHTSNPGGSVKSQGWSLVSKATPAARSMC